MGIASKDKKLDDILANTTEPAWKNISTPSYDCGKIVKSKSWPFYNYTSEYREDAVTYSKVEEVLNQHQPKLVLINFREPDYSAHQNDCSNYIKGIKDTYEYVYKLWQFIETHPSYKGETTLFVINDHGLHADGYLDRFFLHTHKSEACKRISLLTMDFDFKKSQVFDSSRELIDISATIAALLKFNFPSNGKIITELFE